MSVNWANLDQKLYDRIVEALVRHRFGNKVRSVNGRGGDQGIDIEVRSDSERVWILQLKYFPEGFSSVYGNRRKEIGKSFRTAKNHSPAKWSLVVPCLCTTREHNYVMNLNGDQTPPKITVIDRDELDAWMADAPSIDAYVQRTATSELREMARDFSQEQAALLGGVSDLTGRIQNLGQLVDSVDVDWAVNFARDGNTTSVSIHPRDADAPSRSPIGFAVQLGEVADEHAELHQHLMRNIGYGTSETLRIPQDAVRSVRIEGPEFIAGEYPPGAVEIVRGPRGSAVGQLLELHAFREDDLLGSYEGRITHAAPGPVGGSIEATFCNGHLNARLRVPHNADQTNESPEFMQPGIEYELDYGPIRPSAVQEVLSTRRILCLATRIEAHYSGNLLAVMSRSEISAAIEDYDSDLMEIEQFAYDLDVVQRHTGRFFDIPEHMRLADRVNMRVARLLIEGYIVAAPRAERFTMQMTGNDSPEVRASLSETRSIVWPAGPFAVIVDDRELTIGDVYAMHPAATPINGEDAIDALNVGEAHNFEVHFRPGDDPYFYLTLANAPPPEVTRRSIALWSLYGVDQPGVSDSI